MVILKAHGKEVCAKLKYTKMENLTRKIWLLYFNRMLLESNIISQQDYRSMKQKIYSLPS